MEHKSVDESKQRKQLKHTSYRPMVRATKRSNCLCVSSTADIIHSFIAVSKLPECRPIISNTLQYMTNARISCAFASMQRLKISVSAILLSVR